MAEDATPIEVELKAVDNNTQRQLNFSAAATVAFAFAFLMLAMTLAAPAAEMGCLLYTSPSPRDLSTSRMPSSA